MKTIEVVAAVIIRDGKVFATQRGYGPWKGWWDYPEFHLTMHCFLCSLVSPKVHLNEHSEARWLTTETLDSVQWLPADEGLIRTLKK